MGWSLFRQVESNQTAKEYSLVPCSFPYRPILKGATMSEKKEHLSDRGKENIARETREAIKPVIDKLTQKFEKIGFDKKDFDGAIREGIKRSAEDVKQ
jgi:hypothetical protein